MSWFDETVQVPSWVHVGAIVVGFICIGIVVPYMFKLTWLFMDFLHGTSTWI